MLARPYTKIGLTKSQQYVMLELLMNKKLRPCEINKLAFSTESQMSVELKGLEEKKYITKFINNTKNIYFMLTLKGLLFTKILALNEPRYCSCLKKEYIEFILEPDGST